MMTLNFDIQTDEQKMDFYKVLAFVKSLKLPVHFDDNAQFENDPEYDIFLANMMNDAIQDPDNQRVVGKKQLFTLLD